MLRRLFTFMSFLSLLLCVATCLLWVRGHYVEDWLTFLTAVGERRSDRVLAASYAGNCMVLWDHYTFPASGRDVFVSEALSGRVESELQWSVNGYDGEEAYQNRRQNFGRGLFNFETVQEAQDENLVGLRYVQRNLRFPIWCLAVALVIFPAAWLRQWLRTRGRLATSSDKQGDA